MISMAIEYLVQEAALQSERGQSYKPGNPLYDWTQEYNAAFDAASLSRLKGLVEPGQALKLILDMTQWNSDDWSMFFYNQSIGHTIDTVRNAFSDNPTIAGNAAGEITGGILNTGIGAAATYGLGQAMTAVDGMLTGAGSYATADVRKFSEYIFKDRVAPGKDIVFKNL